MSWTKIVINFTSDICQSVKTNVTSYGSWSTILESLEGACQKFQYSGNSGDSL